MADAVDKCSEIANEGLATSVLIFEEIKRRVGTSKDDDVVNVPVRELKRLRKAAVKVNKAISRLCKASFDTETRLTMELQLLRQVMRRDVIDREANRARVFQKLKNYHDQKPQAGTTATENNVDRAVWAVATTEAAINNLAPPGCSLVQGSSILHALENDF